MPYSSFDPRQGHQNFNQKDYKMENPIKIEFNDRHLDLLIVSLECALRLRLKQVDIALETVFPENWKEVSEMRESNVFRVFDNLLSSLPDTKDKNWNEIHSIYQLLRQYVSYKRNNWKKGFGVNFHDPHILATAPLPKIVGWDSKNGVRES